MPSYIALLRGVNAGGANTLRSKDFVALLEQLGLKQVKTYIQTGNAVFQTTATNAKALPEDLKTAIKDRLGFTPEVIVLSLAELEEAIAANPFPDADDSPKAVHLTFLTEEPDQPDFEALEQVTKASEAFKLEGEVFYFYAPEGVGRSRAFSKIEKTLGVSGTARNWRTVNKLLEMARELEEAS